MDKVGSLKFQLEQDRYEDKSLLCIFNHSSCVLPRRFVSPCEWEDLKELFGRPATILFKILSECLDPMFDVIGHVINIPMPASFM